MPSFSLPLPSKTLNPNTHCHWKKKAKAVKAARELAHGIALKVGWRPRLDKAAVECRWFFKDRRRRDQDNLSASLKAYWDGLVDAGVFSDDSGLVHLPALVDVDKENPRVEIHVVE